jgi:hypothetical protein
VWILPRTKALASIHGLVVHLFGHLRAGRRVHGARAIWCRDARTHTIGEDEPSELVQACVDYVNQPENQISMETLAEQGRLTFRAEFELFTA